MKFQSKRHLIIGLVLLFTLVAAWRVSGDPDDEQLVPTASSLSNETTSTTRNNVNPTVFKAGEPRKSAYNLPKVKDLDSLYWPTTSRPDAPVFDLFNLPKATSEIKGTGSAPTVPVMNLNYIGRFKREERMYVMLADATGTLSVVAEGDHLPGGWRYVSAAPSRLLFRHEASKAEHIVPINQLN